MSKYLLLSIDDTNISSSSALDTYKRETGCDLAPKLTLD